MKDKFIKKLLARLNSDSIKASQIKTDVENLYIDGEERVIPISNLTVMIQTIDEMLEEENKRIMPKTKFLYVEDGSVDLDELQSDLLESNPEIKIIVYRQGSHPPILSDKE